VARTGVAVEKVGFSENSRQSGDRKCLEDWGKSFVELPDAIQFLQIHGERVFEQPQRLSPAIPECDRSCEAWKNHPTVLSRA
jgi:hypothetical protein